MTDGELIGVLRFIGLLTVTLPLSYVYQEGEYSV